MEVKAQPKRGEWSGASLEAGGFPAGFDRILAYR
jgi:hypothetical protein